MNKFRFLTWAVILLLLLNAGTLVYLFTSNRAVNNQPPGNGAPGFIIEQLKLDARQQEQFAQLRRQHQDLIRSLQDEDRRLHDMYFGLLKTDNPDRAKEDSVSSLIARQRTLTEKATFDHFQQLRKLCREDQKKLFDATIDEIARRIGGPKGPPNGGPPPPGR